MSRTATQPPRAKVPSNGDPFSRPLETAQHLFLDFVSWGSYEHFLKETESRRVKITFDNGDLELMSPLPEHEDASRMIFLLVVTLAEELDIALRALGGTTFRRRLLQKGLEPDECFYIKNQSRVRGRKRLTLPKDPPPDLAVEVDVMSWSIPRLPIYAALGVPEIWRYDGKRMECLHLNDGEYRNTSHSLSFPMLKPVELVRFIKMGEADDQIKAIQAFRKWVRKQGWAK